MYHVTVYPLSLGLLYTSYIWTGLSDLEAEGKITLSVSGWPNTKIREVNGLYVHPDNLCAFYMKVEDRQRKLSRKIFIDLMDGVGINSESGIKDCDIYFKRSYRDSFIQNQMRFPAHKHKVHPFGLYFPVSSPHQKNEFKRFVMAEINSGSLLNKPRSTVWRLRHEATNWREKRKARKSANDWSRNDKREFEVLPDTPTKNQVMFLTRVFDPYLGWNADNPEYVHGLNEQRAEIIRGMRKAFGERFIGGFISDEWTRENYPDCVAQVSTKRSDYLALLRDSKGAITTTGLVDSIPAKLAEYMAASRCILTDELRFELPYEVQHRKHAMIFSTADQCIEHAEAILSDDQLAQTLRNNAYDLYKQSIEPAKSILRCIEMAVAA